jgi:hypothetical protein
MYHTWASDEHIHDEHAASVVTDGDASAIGCKIDSQERIVTLEAGNFAPAPDLPQPQRVVLRAGDDVAAIGGERHRCH